MIHRFFFLAALSLFIVQQQDQAPYRVPDPDHPGHFKRPDGAKCSVRGDHPCTCKVVCSNGAAVAMSPECQWHCKEDHCTCHPCAESECSDEMPNGHTIMMIGD